MKNIVNLKHVSLLAITILTSCGQNSHMTMDAEAALSDLIAPTASLSGGASGSTNTALQTITVTFGEAIVDSSISSGDFNITNGVLSNLSCLPVVAPTACTFDVTASGQGAVSVALPAAAVQDAAGNSNYASNVIAWTYDSVGPIVSLAIEVGEPASGSSTNDSSIALTLTSSEALAGLLTGDFTCTNCTVSGISGSGTAWTLIVVPSGIGAVSVEVAASAVQDAAGNSNTLASNNLNWTYNNIAPAFTLAPASGAPASGGATNISPVAVELSSSSDVTGLVAGDVICTGCTISNFSGSASAYTFDVTPSGQGAFSVNVPASVAQDAATNQNTTSNTLNWSYDTSAPSATLAVGSGGAASGSTTNAASIPVTVVMGESVTGLVAGDFTCTNCTLSGFSGSGTNYSFNVIPTTSGAVSVQLPAGRALDNAGNGNTISNSLSWTYDNTAPTVALSGAPVSGYANSAQTITATFSESMNVATLSSADVSVSNGSVSAFSCSGSPTACTFTVTPTANGAVTVGMAASVAQDNAGNNNIAATNISWTHDATVPIVASDAPGTGGAAFGSSITSSSTVSVDVTFSEAIQTSSVTAADFDPSSPGDVATISGVSCASSTVCTVTLSVSAVTTSGTVSLQLNTPSILDLAGNNVSTTTLPTSATWNFSASVVVDFSKSEECSDLAVDALDNVICVGFTQGNIGETKAGTAFTANAFIKKQDRSGNLTWVKQIGSGSFGALMPGGDVTLGSFAVSVETDSSGNIYVGGWTQGALGETNGGSSGNSDFYVMKLDSTGSLVWIQQAGDGLFGQSIGGDRSGAEVLTDLKLNEANGKIYGTGYTSHNLGETNAGGYDIFIFEIDLSTGSLGWLKQMGSGSFGSSFPGGTANGLNLSSDEVAYGINIDPISNDLVITGSTGTGSIGEDYGGDFFDSMGNPYNGDALIFKLDQSGNLVWVRQIGAEGRSGLTNNYDYIFYKSVITSSGDIYLSVGSANSSDSGCALGVYGKVLKFDSNGNYLNTPFSGWTGDGCRVSNRVSGLALNQASGVLYVSGDGTNLDSFGPQFENDIFLVKVDTSTDIPIWEHYLSFTHQPGDSLVDAIVNGNMGDLSGQDKSNAIALDSAGDLVISGSTTGSFGEQNAGMDDILLFKIDLSANLLWLRQAGLGSYGGSF